MSLRDKLGLYGPNKSKWTEEVYDAIMRSGVSWVVWRTDADPVAPMRLYRMGKSVVAQAVDMFSGDPWKRPEDVVGYVKSRVVRVCPPGTPLVLDNEPNQFAEHSGPWYAEQYTRFLRAVYALWRWQGFGGDYPLVFPALMPGPDRATDVWLAIAREDLNESDYVGLHAYWQRADLIDSYVWGRPWSRVELDGVPGPCLVLEYGNTLPNGGHAAHLAEYETWLRTLPDRVQAACLFILDPTPDWSHLAVTPEVIDWLAALED